MRSENRGFYQSRQRNLRRAILPVLILAVAGSVALYVVIRNSNAIVPDDMSSVLQQAWLDQDYQYVSELSDRLLTENPLDSTLLLYNGISHFYYAITIVNHDERQNQLNRSMFSLRKLLVNPPPGNEAQVWYILGKVYYHKGRYYYDSSRYYLEQARAAGIEAYDILEYLGVILIDLGQSEEGLAYIEDAIDQQPSDILYFTAAEEFERLGDADKALDYYDTALAMTGDSLLRQESNIGRAKIYYSEQNYDRALDILNEVVAENTQSAEALYYIGEIYAAQGDLVRARASWREAYNQDRTFAPALERLQS